MNLMCHRSFDPFESPHDRIFLEVPAGGLIKGDAKGVSEWINATGESSEAAKSLAEEVNAQVEAIKDGTRNDLVKLYVDVFTTEVPAADALNMPSVKVDSRYQKKGLLEVLEKNCPVLKAAFEGVPDLRLLAYGNIYKELKDSTPPMDANYLPIGSEVWMTNGRVFVKQPSGKMAVGLLFPWDVYEIAKSKYPGVVMEEAEKAKPAGQPSVDLYEEEPVVPPVSKTPPPVPEVPTEPSPWESEPAPPAVGPTPVSEPTPEAATPVPEHTPEAVAEDPLEKDWEMRVVPMLEALELMYPELLIIHEDFSLNAPAHSKIVRFKNTLTTKEFNVMVVMPMRKKNVPGTYEGARINIQIIHKLVSGKDVPVFIPALSSAQKRGDVIMVLSGVASVLVSPDMIDSWTVDAFNRLANDRQLYYLGLFSQHFREEALVLERSRKPSVARYNALVLKYKDLKGWHESLKPWVSALPSPATGNRTEDIQRAHKAVLFDLDNPNDPNPDDAGLLAILERMHSRVPGAVTLPVREGAPAGTPTPAPEASSEVILKAKQERVRVAAAVLRMPDLLDVGTFTQEQISILLQSYRDDAEFTSAVDTLMQNYPQVGGKTFGRINFHQLNPPDATGVRSVIVEVETMQGSVIFKAEVSNANPAAVQEYVAAHADLGNTLTPEDVAELSAFLNLKYEFELAMSIHKTQLDDFYAAYKAKMTEAPLPTSREGVAAEATHLRGIMDAAGSSPEQVNAAYERLMNLYTSSPENLSRQDHFKGATAAFALGDAQKAYERFQNAERVATDSETIQYIEGIENRFGHVHITIPRGQQGDFELLPDPDPIDDVLDHAIAFANKKLNETGTFDGFLPVSTRHDGSNIIRYRYGSQEIWFQNLNVNSSVQEHKLKREKLGAGGSGAVEAEPTRTADEVLLGTPSATPPGATSPEVPVRIPAVAAAETTPAAPLGAEAREGEITRIKEELNDFTDVWYRRASINLTDKQTGQKVERYLRPDSSGSVYKDRLRVLEIQLDPNNREHQELRQRLDKIKTFQKEIAGLYEELGSVEVFISQMDAGTPQLEKQKQVDICEGMRERVDALVDRTEFQEMATWTDLLSPGAREFVHDFYGEFNPLDYAIQGQVSLLTY